MAAGDIGKQLLREYKQLYKQHHGEAYVGSLYRDASMLKGVADDIGADELRAVMQWYFERRSRHDFTNFIFDYDKLMKVMRAEQRDQAERERLRELTRQRMAAEGIEL